MSVWPLKIIVKLLLSFVPGRHRILRRFGIFRHGEMDSVAYAHKIFTIHMKRAFPNGFPSQFTALELGPGDSVFSALIAKGYGASKIYLADAGHYAQTDIELYKHAAKQLRNEYKIDAPDIEQAQSFEEILDICDAVYITNGLAGLQDIPDASVDFIWSHAVLEHIRLTEYAPTMRELARVVKKKNGRVSHNVDLKDHLDYSLNNLRFSEALWEKDFIAQAGFYTNRLRYTQSVKHMVDSGFNIIDEDIGRWDQVPLAQEKLWGPFKEMSDEELIIRGFSVVLQAA